MVSMQDMLHKKLWGSKEVSRNCYGNGFIWISISVARECYKSIACNKRINAGLTDCKKWTTLECDLKNL